MSQSMSLTKFTTHLDERHSWRVHIISALQTFREHFVSAGVLSCTPEMWQNKGRKRTAPAQFDEILSVPPLLLPDLPLLAECLQCVPDENPRAAWAEGREGVPWNAGSRRHGGRKGMKQILGISLYFSYATSSFVLGSGLLRKCYERMSI